MVAFEFQWQKTPHAQHKTVTAKGNIIVIYENNNENDLNCT